MTNQPKLTTFNPDFSFRCRLAPDGALSLEIHAPDVALEPQRVCLYDDNGQLVRERILRCGKLSFTIELPQGSYAIVIRPMSVRGGGALSWRDFNSWQVGGAHVGVDRKGRTLEEDMCALLDVA